MLQSRGLVEDGFTMLAPFTGRELRQTIRVKFYNDLGVVLLLFIIIILINISIYLL